MKLPEKLIGLGAIVAVAVVLNLVISQVVPIGIAVASDVWVGSTYDTYATASDIAADYFDISTGSGATIKVAASNSSALSKADADYVCSGADDQEEIQTAIDILPSTGGTVVLFGGTYSLSKGFNLNKDNSKLVGEGHTTVLSLASMPKSSLASDAGSGQAAVILEDVSGFREGLAVMITDNNDYGMYTIQSVSTENNSLTFTSNLMATYTVVANALVVGHGYPAFTVDGENIEVYGFTVYGNRANRSGGVDNLMNGGSDGSRVVPPEGDYADGVIAMGYHGDSENVSLHDLWVNNSSSFGIGIWATHGHRLNNIFLYNNTMADIGDKAIVARYYEGQEGIIGNIEIVNNFIDGTGKANLNDGSDGKFSWGDGIQLHSVAPRRVVIADNTVNDTARSGIWVMWSDESNEETLISGNRITNWGQKVFGNEDQINVSGIHVNRGMVNIADNILDGGFTPDSPRADRCFGINVSPSMRLGGTKKDIIVSGNTIKNFYGDPGETIGIRFYVLKDAVVSDNFVSGGYFEALSLTAVSGVDIRGNNFGELNLVFTDSTIADVLFENNIFRCIDMREGTYSDIRFVGNILTIAPTGVDRFTEDSVSTPSFTWDAPMDNTSGVASYEVKIDDEDYIDIGNVTVYTHTTALSDGSHTFYVRAKDAVGNTGTAISMQFTIDTNDLPLWIWVAVGVGAVTVLTVGVMIGRRLVRR